jgi:hypothetical protein
MYVMVEVAGTPDHEDPDSEQDAYCEKCVHFILPGGGFFPKIFFILSSRRPTADLATEWPSEHSKAGNIKVNHGAINRHG